MKAFIIGLVAIVLIVAAVVALNRTDIPNPDPADPALDTNDEMDTDPITTEETPSFTTPANTRLQAEPDYGYAIALPYVVDVSDPQPGITRYRYVGPESAPDTEIIDGYTITVGAARARATSTMGVAVQNIQGNRETTLAEPETVTLAEQQAVRYQVASELNDQPITKYALLPNNGYEYTISVNLAGGTTSYEAEIDTILSSLQFYSDDVATSVANRIVSIAMLDYEPVGNQYIRESGGPVRGCDAVTYVEHVLPEATATPVESALQQLFAYERETVGGWQNFIATQNDTLSFDRVEVTTGTAHIYLNGTLGSLSGVCDNPRTAIQIEETALVYEGVESVALYLNGNETDLIPDGRGE